MKDGTYFTLDKKTNGTLMASVGNSLACNLLLGYLVLPLYACIASYIDRITPRKNGIAEHPLFFL